MTQNIGTIVGPFRAAELVNSYRRRLQEADLLSEKAALSAACTAYAFQNVYVVAAPGQIWESSIPDSIGEKDRLAIMEISHDDGLGHRAMCRKLCGIMELIPLHQLAENYKIVSWPDHSAQV